MSPRRVAFLWYSWLTVWALSLLVYGAVSPGVLASTTLAVAVLYFLSGRLGRPIRVTRPALILLVLPVIIVLIHLLPVPPFLIPETARFRERQGLGAGVLTADVFRTVYTGTQVLVYVLSALLVRRLCHLGLPLPKALGGIGSVLLLEAAYGISARLMGWGSIPFFGERVSGMASGTLVNTNQFGALMGIGMVIGLGLAVSRFLSAWHRRRFDTPEAAVSRRRYTLKGWGWCAACVVCGIGLFLSHSAGAVLSTIVALLAVPGFSRRRVHQTLLLGVLLMGGGGLLIVESGTVPEKVSWIREKGVQSHDRWGYWISTLRAAHLQPVLGFGIGSMADSFHPYQPPSIQGQVSHAHNEYVTFLFEGGVIWLSLLLAGFAWWFFRAHRATLDLQGSMKPLGLISLAVGVLIGVHSLVDFDLRITSVGMLVAVLMALGVSSGREGRPMRRMISWGLGVAAVLFPAALVFGGLDSDRWTDQAAEILEQDPEGSERLCVRALTLSPMNFRPAWTRAKALEFREGSEKADESFEVASDLFPAHPELQRASALYFWEGYEQTGSEIQLHRTVRCTRRLFEQDPFSATHGVLAMLEEMDAGSRSLEVVSALIPPVPGAQAAYAAWLVQRGQWREGQEVFIRGCPERPGNARAFDYYAHQLERMKHYGMEAAVRDRRLALEFSAEPAAAAAHAWERLGVFDKALQRAEQARAADPRNAGWYWMSGRIQSKQGDLEGAVRTLSEGLRLAPNDQVCLLLRAELLVRLGRWDAAERDFRDCLRGDPEYADAVSGLVQLLEQGGRKAEALRLVEGYLKAHPGDSRMLELKGRLE